MGKQVEGNGARRRQRRSFTPAFKAEGIARAPGRAIAARDLPGVGPIGGMSLTPVMPTGAWRTTLAPTTGRGHLSEGHTPFGPK